jgi:hypothetical protein
MNTLRIDDLPCSIELDREARAAIRGARALTPQPSSRAVADGPGEGACNEPAARNEFMPAPMS